MLHTDFDPVRTAVINPAQTIEKVADMPAGMIGVFSQKIVNAYYGSIQQIY